MAKREMVKKNYSTDVENGEKSEKKDSKRKIKAVFYNSPGTNRKSKGRKGRPCGYRG